MIIKRGKVNQTELSNALKQVKIEELGMICVDPALSFRERISRAKLDSVDKLITASALHLTRKVRRKIVLYSGQTMTPYNHEGVRQLMWVNGDQPAGLDDALAIALELFACWYEKASWHRPATGICFVGEKPVCTNHEGRPSVPKLEWVKWLGESEPSRKLVLSVSSLDCITFTDDSTVYAAVRRRRS